MAAADFFTVTLGAKDPATDLTEVRKPLTITTEGGQLVLSLTGYASSNFDTEIRP